MKVKPSPATKSRLAFEPGVEEQAQTHTELFICNPSQPVVKIPWKEYSPLTTFSTVDDELHDSALMIAQLDVQQTQQHNKYHQDNTSIMPLLSVLEVCKVVLPGDSMSRMPSVSHEDESVVIMLGSDSSNTNNNHSNDNNDKAAEMEAMEISVEPDYTVPDSDSAFLHSQSLVPTQLHQLEHEKYYLHQQAPHQLQQQTVSPTDDNNDDYDNNSLLLVPPPPPEMQAIIPVQIAMHNLMYAQLNCVEWISYGKQAARRDWRERPLQQRIQITNLRKECAKRSHALYYESYYNSMTMSDSYNSSNCS
ncbi:hypothetical protein HK100_011280 [Physocladia obscura]|uniref:Uncharacterized protein n=1 Tax=Physocladia obscura TaxID=109957 RepID=A0AAD5T2W6_9FUNG|nr:hypothetical protein HK100_011280 [Physocladia obscura]